MTDYEYGGDFQPNTPLDIRNLRLADFVHDFNKTRQRFSDVILQEGDGPTVIPTLAKKITSELAEVSLLTPLGLKGVSKRIECSHLTPCLLHDHPLALEE